MTACIAPWYVTVMLAIGGLLMLIGGLGMSRHLRSIR